MWVIALFDDCIIQFPRIPGMAPAMMPSGARVCEIQLYPDIFRKCFSSGREVINICYHLATGRWAGEWSTDGSPQGSLCIKFCYVSS